MTAQLTPKEAKAIAERHLKSLGFTLEPRRSGPMQIRARGVVAEVTLGTTPVSLSELVMTYGERRFRSRDAMAYFALNGYGKTAVDYATAKGIQLYGFDSSGRVTERNHVGLRAPSAAPTTGAAPTTPSGASSRVSFSKPVSPLPPASASTGSGPVRVTAEASPDASAGRRTKRWMAGVGVALLSVVAGSLMIGTNDSDSGSVEPVRVVSTTVRSSVPATPSAPTRAVMQPLSGAQSSSVATTAPTYMPPPPVYTPAYTPPPVYTPAPAPAPQSSAYYKNCAAARAAGAAPLYIGEPGYRSKLDADGDGVACEWS